jgi:hypothetical protein
MFTLARNNNFIAPEFDFVTISPHAAHELQRISLLQYNLRYSVFLVGYLIALSVPTIHSG